MSTAATPSLRIVVAKNAGVAVVLRRGPSRWVRMILWDLRKDTFQLGQWLNARIGHFDISDKGEYFLYFVQSYRPQKQFDTWVALSKPPWFSALAVWSVGDSWGGQCHFASPHKIYISAGFPTVELEKGKLPSKWSWAAGVGLNPHDLVTKRRGWQVAATDMANFSYTKSSYDSPYRIVESYAAGHVHFVLCDPKNKVTFSFPEGTTSADWDRRGRVLTTEIQGRLCVWEERKGQWTKTVALETQAMKPDSLVAPKSALKW